jgi:hypothetical protein
MKGYMGALQANKIKMDPDLIYPGNISIESGKTGQNIFYPCQILLMQFLP